MNLHPSWVSVTNCSRSYNTVLSGQEECDFAAGGWQFGCLLTTDHIWDAFTILTLLDYNERKGTCLQVLQTGDQRTRFKDVMVAQTASTAFDLFTANAVIFRGWNQHLREKW
ncbi:hypothetical protein DFH07DRAFT_955163 [Mycena maculata]|uniref:Uncharacterized protein n=1 Tax=Mycena maculata TaxID=230809 RepID=A0AAD7JND5_9AGAR|nr:hypothetical protein DFH07DRAFT_955163 [Mycena maculata]